MKFRPRLKQVKNFKLIQDFPALWRQGYFEEFRKEPRDSLVSKVRGKEIKLNTAGKDSQLWSEEMLLELSHHFTTATWSSFDATVLSIKVEDLLGFINFKEITKILTEYSKDIIRLFSSLLMKHIQIEEMNIWKEPDKFQEVIQKSDISHFQKPALKIQTNFEKFNSILFNHTSKTQRSGGRMNIFSPRLKTPETGELMGLSSKRTSLDAYSKDLKLSLPPKTSYFSKRSKSVRKVCSNARKNEIIKQRLTAAPAGFLLKSKQRKRNKYKVVFTPTGKKIIKTKT